MKVRTLVDTGPLVALLKKDEAHHDWVSAAFRQLPAAELDPVPPAQEIGRGQPGDARADDRNVLHAALRNTRSVRVMSSICP